MTDKHEMTKTKWLIVIAFAVALWGTFYGINHHAITKLYRAVHQPVQK